MIFTIKIQKNQDPDFFMVILYYPLASYEFLVACKYLKEIIARSLSDISRDDEKEWDSIG